MENDDLFDADQVLLVGRTARSPVLFDWLHHRAKFEAQIAFFEVARFDCMLEAKDNDRALLGDDEALARPLAARDAVIGIALLAARSTLPLFCRAGADLTDASRVRRRSPWSAAAGLASASWSLGTAAFSRSAIITRLGDPCACNVRRVRSLNEVISTHHVTR